MRLIFSVALICISLNNLDCHNNNGQKLSTRQNFFDIELLRASVENKKENVIISPASIKSTLAMLLAGADGSTAKEIKDALRLSSVNQELRDQLHLYLSALRNNTTTAVLESTNGIFVSRKLKLNPKYEAILKVDFKSEVTRVDYGDPNAAALVINSWVREHTHGLVPFIIEPAQVDAQTDLVLANALFFKSSWFHAFDPRQTKRSCFYRNGACEMVAMMDQEVELNYAHVEELNAHAVELPYEGKHYSMILLIPLEKTGLEGLIRDLPYVSLSEILNQMHPELVTLSMPKFTVNYSEDLVETLTKLHITSLFSNKSNLTGIFEGNPPHVNSFHHKVFMSVDETGTVAAASSTAAVVPLIFNGVQVRADRPFLFFIRDNELGITIFEGKIEQPPLPEQGSSDQIPVHPSEENKKLVQTVQSSNPRPKQKSNSFVENLRSIFG